MKAIPDRLIQFVVKQQNQMMAKYIPPTFVDPGQHGIPKQWDHRLFPRIKFPATNETTDCFRESKFPQPVKANPDGLIQFVVKIKTRQWQNRYDFRRYRESFQARSRESYFPQADPSYRSPRNSMCRPGKRHRSDQVIWCVVPEWGAFELQLSSTEQRIVFPASGEGNSWWID